MSIRKAQKYNTWKVSKNCSEGISIWQVQNHVDTLKPGLELVMGDPEYENAGSVD
jgi:hypothetical protein